VIIFCLLIGKFHTSLAAKQKVGGEGNISKTLSAIRKKGVLTIGSSNDVPFSYIDVSTNEIKGVDGKIALELAKRLGIKKVKLKVVAFENLLIELNNSSVDMIASGMYVNNDRKKIALFTNGWYKEGDTIIVKKNSLLKEKADLKNCIVASGKGMLFLEMIQRWQKDGFIKEARAMNSQTEMLLAVNTGKIDACITDSLLTAYTLKTDSGLQLKMMDNYKSEASGIVAAALRLEDKKFCNELNTALNEMKNDGTIMRILKEYGISDKFFIPAGEDKTY